MTVALTQRTLILVRHAKSDWSGDDADIARPLASRGRRQAPEAGRWLNANIERVDLALVSPAERTRSTWQLVALELEAAPPSRLEPRLYGASADDLLTVVRELPDELDTVLLVGHNPDIEELVRHLTGEWVRMRTSEIAVLTWPGSWASAGDVPATLRASGRPPAQ